MKYIFFGILLVYATNVSALEPANNTDYLQGTVYGLEFDEAREDTLPLVAVNVFWRDRQIGVTTDTKGQFQIARPENGAGFLVFNYVGYENDTLSVKPGENNLIIHLKTLQSLEKVYVSADKPNIMHDKHAAINSESITSKGLTQLACCSLAESFENTTSVEVEQSDAVSGARRIKMLGLAGFYTQMMIEKKPVMRGLVNPFALEYVPGYWMESVSISKGTASVSTGYESITGQINVDLKKPEDSEPFSANGYVNSMGKTDIALLGAHKFSPRLSVMLLTYGTYMQKRWDTNDDTFMDMPLTQQFNIMNRWKYSGEKMNGQIGIKLIHDDRRGGQMGFNFANPQKTSSLYGSDSKIRRYEIYTKSGIALDNQGSSLGLILSAFQYRIDSFWGLKTYTGDESSFFANLAYKKIIADHTVTAGLSYQYEERDESYLQESYEVTDRVAGVFTEFTIKPSDTFTALAGIRYDHHNRYGALFTPRAHLNYRPNDETSIRLSAGTGFRNPHIFMDNPAILASSKELVLLEDIDLEKAWNAGIQYTQDFVIGTDRPATFVLDYYRTEFQNQIVVDMEQSARHIYLYNLDGQSYSNAIQAELSASVAPRFDLTTAVRYNDVKTTYHGEVESVPLNSTYKGLVTLSYTTPENSWQFDLTTQINSEARLPNTRMNPVQYQLEEYAPGYLLMFMQFKRKFETWELYAGIENLTGYRQKNPILAWDNPFSPYFDASMIWGPTFGRRFYIGFRFH